VNPIALNVFKWYVVYTHPNFEKKVYNSLQQRDIISFLPFRKITRQWSDRKKTMEVPLFPNYLFVYTTIHDRFKVLEVPGAARYISFDGTPVTITDNEISMIKKMMTEPDVMIESYLEGDSVKITDGPFTGLTGIVFERKGRTRFGVKLNAINQSLSVEFNRSSIAKIQY
jgi:transcriptional antiterminator RfaH